MQSFDHLSSILFRFLPVRRAGQIRSIEATSVTLSGLSDVASVGHRVSFSGPDGATGEVVGVSEESVLVLPEGGPGDLRIRQTATLFGQPRLFPDESWLGRVIDGDGQPLDGLPLIQGHEARRLDDVPPPATQRREMGARLATGYALFNTMLPIVRGQRLGLFSGSGVGKSSLMAAFARDVEADVVVIALIGERGREVRHFIEDVLGRNGLSRSVVVAATSDQPALARRRAAFAAMAVAEYFRDQGRHVLLMLDSITRLAEAHREIASASGEPSSMRGFPPSMSGLLAGFAERAGPGKADQGDITAILTVLVSGSDMEEPVADTLRGLLDGHIVLSREIAERGRFPAVDVLQSVSRSLPMAASEAENALISRARRALNIYEASEIMVRSGLYQSGTNPELDAAVAQHPLLDAFAETRMQGIAASFDKLREALEPAAATADQAGGASV